MGPGVVVPTAKGLQAEAAAQFAGGHLDQCGVAAVRR